MLEDLFRSFRVKQWIKNGFLFAGLIFDGQLFNFPSLLRTTIGFFLFCFLTSGVYLLNDILDIEADRQHPIKKTRPIASGKLPISRAITAAFILFTTSFTGAYFLSIDFLLLCGIYFFLNLLYSKWLKHIPILDVMIIAIGFVIRVAAGVSLIQVKRFSPWLYVVTTLLALYIGFGKRRAELHLLSDQASQHRVVFDGYSLPFLDQLITIVSSMTIIAYSLYTFSVPTMPEGYSMMLTIPFVMYGVFRYLYLLQVVQTGGVPEDTLLQDKPLQITMVLYAICVLVIFYVV